MAVTGKLTLMAGGTAAFVADALEVLRHVAAMAEAIRYHLEGRGEMAAHGLACDRLI